jgi:hypothetical protein
MFLMMVTKGIKELHRQSMTQSSFSFLFYSFSDFFLIALSSINKEKQTVKVEKISIKFWEAMLILS